MSTEHTLLQLNAALTSTGFVVHENDDSIQQHAPFPGDAIAYIQHDAVNLYLLEGTSTEKGETAADKAVRAIQDAGLDTQGEADPAQVLLNGKVIVKAKPSLPPRPIIVSHTAVHHATTR
ncbi:hypothetical protein OHA25_09145 [Nonomuraea sp. NBC_00507]|uniref:hypothetical protein n=1 Tax=Nonomuraea sp. NBC_00507 TaxID=2976002 RepID=UPI002E18963B